MLQPTFYEKTDARSGLTQVLGTIIDRVKSLAVACLFVEKCRFCGREIALAADYHRSESKENNLYNDLPHLTDSENLASLPTKLDSLTIFEDTSEINLPALNAVPERHSNGLFSMLARSTKALIQEWNELSLAATHAKLVAPALIYFAKHPSLSPRLSECLCSLCWEEIEVDLPLLGFCPLPNQQQQSLPVASGVAYQGKAKALIRAFKYEGDATLAPDLASLMSIGWSALTDYMPASRIVLVPVPLHRSRKENRGYNQAELLANELGKITAAPIMCRALQRTKATKSQQLLGRLERLENVRNAFVGQRHQLQDKSVVLVDDVCTSGSTLVACAEEALRCGASSVVAITVARALLTSVEKRL